MSAGLLALGHIDVSVLDVAEQALEVACGELGARAQQVVWICSDLLAWQPARSYRLWHDRAVLHFLTDPRDQEAYGTVVRRALAPGGHAVIATFAPDGRAHRAPVRRARRARTVALPDPARVRCDRGTPAAGSPVSRSQASGATTAEGIEEYVELSGLAYVRQALARAVIWAARLAAAPRARRWQ